MLSSNSTKDSLLILISETINALYCAELSNAFLKLHGLVNDGLQV